SIKLSSKVIINKSIMLIILSYTLIISSISMYSNNLSNYKYPFDFGKDYLRSSVYKGQIILTREGSKGLFVLPYISDVKDFRPDIDFRESIGLFKIRHNQEYLPAAYYYVHFNLDTYLRKNNKDEPLIALQPMGLLLVAAPHSQSELNIFLPWLYIKIPEKTSSQHEYDPYIKQRYLFFRGLAYLYADNMKKAESDFEQINKIGNSNDFIFSMGLAFFKKKHFNKSLSYFEKAAKMQGNNPIIWKYLTINYAMLKKFDKAQEALKMSEKLEKKSK
ncbi:MAG: hypothetical protein JXA60_05550, partial [Candidatus Coatesbacteria bacterium]|nr:hypothetical protein [Candidatus Coatesbacteria bacterium]